MKVSEIDERTLVAHIANLLAKKGDNVIAGAGEDDCAVLDLGGEEYLIATTDMLHRKTDFHEKMTGWQIGWMSVAVNLSDLAAKGAKPVGVLMAMGLPDDTRLSFIEEIVKGMDDCAKRFGTGIIGGDTESHNELTITGTALGVVKKDALMMIPSRTKTARIAPRGSMKIPSHLRIEARLGCSGTWRSMGTRTVGPVTTRTAPSSTASSTVSPATQRAASAVPSQATTAPTVTRRHTTWPPSRSSANCRLKPPSNRMTATASETAGNKTGPIRRSGSMMPVRGPAATPKASSSKIAGSRRRQATHCAAIPRARIATRLASAECIRVSLVDSEMPA